MGYIRVGTCELNNASRELAKPTRGDNTLKETSVACNINRNKGHRRTEYKNYFYSFWIPDGFEGRDQSTERPSYPLACGGEVCVLPRVPPVSMCVDIGTW